VKEESLKMKNNYYYQFNLT